MAKGQSDFFGNTQAGGGKKTRLLPLNAIAPSTVNGIKDISSDYWFGPLQPTKVIAPSSYRPRQYGYTPGANMSWTPKGEDTPITFDILRALADQWDILRIAIDIKKDQIVGVPFELRPIRQPGEMVTDFKARTAGDKTLRDLTAFWKKPDGHHPWKQWLHLWLEDLIVLDAVALWMSRDKQGKVATVHPLAGDTIGRMLTDQGFTPPPGSTAYQQVVYGMPCWDFDVTDLVYGMQNERTNRRYGFSKVEGIINTVCFGLRRQEWQISEYTSGTVPEALVFLPADLPVNRVKEVQDWFDSILAGDLGMRRRVRFLPGMGSGENARPNVIFPKEPLLKDELDVWLAQVVCAHIGISAQKFLKMANRASAEEANDAAAQEGLKPDVDFVIDELNECLSRMGMANDYEWASQTHRDVDPLKAAQADNLIVGKIVTVNESREDRGRDPRPEPEADQLGSYSPQFGFLPLGQLPPTMQAGGPAGGETGEDGKPKTPAAGAGKDPAGDEPPQKKKPVKLLY